MAAAGRRRGPARGAAPPVGPLERRSSHRGRRHRRSRRCPAHHRRGATWRPIAYLWGYVTAIDFPTARDGFVVLLDPVRSTWDLVASDNGGRSWSVRAALPGHGPRARSASGRKWFVDGVAVEGLGADHVRHVRV